MAVNKNFVVKNGLEVGGGLIYADYDNLVVGVGTTAVDYNFHVIGGIGATDLVVTGFVTTRSLAVSGDTTFGNVTATGIGVTSLNVSGIATINNSIVSGVSTIGNIFVGTAGTSISTHNHKVGIGTTNAMHRFQVGSANTTGFTTTTSGLFVVTYDGKVGVQTGQPGVEHHVFGNQIVTGVVTATTFNGQINSGVGTIATLYSTTSDIDVASVDYLSGINLDYTGISTLGNVVIGSGSTDLIVSGDARVTGILTVGPTSVTINGVNSSISGVQQYNGTNINVSGIITATTIDGTLSGTATSTTNIPNLSGDIFSANTVTSISPNVIVDADINSSANIALSKLATTGALRSTTLNATSVSGTNGYFNVGVATYISGTNLNYIGIGSIGTLDTTVGTIDYLTGNNLNYSGIGTISNVVINNKVITASSGIVTYYGDGSNLAGVTYGIGIRSDGSTIAGAGVTVINFTGSGISTVTANAGIATIFVEGGGAAAVPTQIEITNETASASTHYLTFSAGTTGAQALKVDSSTLTYVPSTNTITANLTGTASNATSATSATNATNATNTAITDETGSASTHYITFVTGTSGNQAQKVDSTGLTYIPSTNTLSGNISGNAATVTTNANLTGDITSVGNATAIASGVIVDADISGSAAISVSKLAASTISGVTLGNNLATLTRGTYLTGSNYNGSAGQTWAVDATSANTASKVVARDGSGNFSAQVITCVDLNSTSDINLKDDIRPFENALATVNQLNGVHFTWKQDDRKSIGVIAQEIEVILPELVTKTEGNKTVNYNGLIGVLIEAVKELSARVEELESKNS